jgi:hypothetical protein
MRLDQSQLENASEMKSAAGRRQGASGLQMELVNCHPWSIGDGISITCNVHSTSHVRGVEMGMENLRNCMQSKFALFSPSLEGFVERDAKTRGLADFPTMPPKPYVTCKHHLKFTCNLFFICIPTSDIIEHRRIPCSLLYPEKTSDAEDERTTSTIAQPSMMQ